MRRRLRAAVPSAVLAAVVFVPLLLTRPGRVGADTKAYLYLDPGRLLERAPSMWDPSIGLGTVTHQNIGYLWPIGPYYWVADVIGVPDWVAQRIWLGAILVVAGIGVRFMLKAMGQEGPHVTAATFCYALTPYVLTLGARLSVILLPYAALPWLIGLTVLALRRRRWREPALFALVVASVGSVNATALILVGVGPLLWVLHEVAVTREVRVRDAAATVGRIGVVTVACSLWWLAGLWTQRGYGIEILRYTETAEVVASAAVSLEVLRGLGYWFFYGEDRVGPWIEASRAYMSRIPLVVLSFVIPALGLVGAAVVRFRERAFFLTLLVVGVLLAMGAHPWDDPAPYGAAAKAFLLSDLGLAMRSLPRAAPLVVLALSVFVGALVASVTAERPRLARPLAAGVMVLAVLSLPPLWMGQMVDPNLDRAEDIPDRWLEAAAALDQRDDGTRVLEVPGSDFASYRWGNTVDPVLPGLMDRPYVARELIPYGSPPSADLLNAFDRQLQELTLDSAAVAPIARYMAVGDISVRSDLSYERYNTPRPRSLWEQLRTAPGLDEALGFGPRDPNTPRPELPLLDETQLAIPPELPDPPEVGILAVDEPESIIRTSSTDAPLVVAGDGEGLVDLASLGLVDGKELVFYSGTLADDEQALRDRLDDDATLVLTDTNRRAGRRWSTVRDNTGITERIGQEPLAVDLTDQRLDVFPDADDDHATVLESRGDVWANATSYGNSVSLTPEDDPGNAVDGMASTAWRTGGFESATGETLRLTYREPVTTDQLRILQAIGGVRSRTITEVEVRLDDGEPLDFELDDSSRPDRVGDDEEAGQVLGFDEQTFSTVDITITATDPGDLRRYEGISAVGFSEVVVTDRDGTTPVADDVVRLPVDLLRAAGADSLDHPLAVSLTRERVAGTVAVRGDPEPSMARTVELPTDRSFELTGQVRLSNRVAGDDVTDRALGIDGAADGGIDATSSRRIPGGLTSRALAAVDGDPDTWWSPGFLGQQTEFVDYVVADEVTVDELSVTVLNDGRHSVPQALLIEVADGDAEPVVQEVALPPIGDQAEPNARHTFDVSLDEPLTGDRVRVVIPDRPDAVRNVETIDWFTGESIATPVGLVELGIDGLEAPQPPEEIDGSCRNDLVEVDGEPLPVTVQGTTEELLAGEAVDLGLCPGTELDLPEGEVTIRTAGGAFTGFDLDRLLLRSAAGGDADPTSGLLIGAEQRTPGPELTVRHQDRTSMDLTVPDADAAYWLVLGQSYSDGWTAAVEGVDLGEPTLVNGYANAWLVPAGAGTDISLSWTPQRLVDVALALSALSVVGALALVIWPRRRAAGADNVLRIPLDRRPSMPRALRLRPQMRYAGPMPSRFALVATVLGALAFGVAVIGTLPGLALGAVALLALRVPGARVVLTAGGPLLLVASAAWLVGQQVAGDLPPGFDWPTYFVGVHQLALVAISLVALDAVIDRCWLRRWWPTDDSPS
ncbi:alpha-(1-_3)-arabinofuranosyltransferase [soil metagenome]